jgi:small subunit ribosomal protein S2
MRDLLDAGVHFGHQTRRWNPKMKPYIFTQRNGIYIVDLRQTAVAFREALDFLGNLAADGGTVMFVGTKRQAQDAVREAAERTGMFFVNQRWLGGLLTNFETIKKSVARLKDLEAMEEDGRMELLPKKEVIKLRRHKFKLFRNLEGIKDMDRIPDAVFVLDVRRERIAILEAANLGIPIVAVVDTNCDPEGIDFVVPGNDDALRSIRLFLGAAADAILAGQKIRDKASEEAALKAAEEAKAAQDAEADEEGGVAAEVEETTAEDAAAEPADVEPAEDAAAEPADVESAEDAAAEPADVEPSGDIVAEPADEEPATGAEQVEDETETAEPEAEPEAEEPDKTED